MTELDRRGLLPGPRASPGSPLTSQKTRGSRLEFSFEKIPRPLSHEFDMVITDRTSLWGAIFLVVLGSDGQVAPRVVPEGPQGLPKVSQRYPKGTPRQPKGLPKVTQRFPKASQRCPKVSQRSPKVSQGSPKVSQSEYFEVCVCVCVCVRHVKLCTTMFCEFMSVDSSVFV